MTLRLVYATSYVLTLAVLNELDYFSLSLIVTLYVACLFSCSSNIIKAFFTAGIDGKYSNTGWLRNSL